MSWFSRIRNALHSRRLDADLHEEIADHLERRAAGLRNEGLDRNEALRQARLRFGNTTRLHEESRGIRLWSTLDTTLQDIRYAWRAMRKAPAFALTAILSLALAIGATTAIYSIVDAAILRPLPVSHPQELFTLSWPDITDPGETTEQERQSFSYPEFLAYTKVTKPAAQLAFFSSPGRAEAQISTADGPIEKVNRAFASINGFDLLGVTPALGSFFSPAQRSTAVLSYEYWQRRFSADPAVIGRVLKVNGEAFQIAGVTRAGFFGVEPGKFVDVWLPPAAYDPRALSEAGWHWFRILGRIAPGVSLGEIQARIQPSFHRFMMERVNRMPTMPLRIKQAFLDSVIRVHPAPNGASDFRRTFSRPLWIVFGVGGVILFIACANVASLLLARSTARAPEMAMRVSLGAARSRLIRQLLTESLVLSLFAGALGWLLARIAAPLLTRLLSIENDPVEFLLAIDTRALLFSIAVSTASAVLFGLIPAWQASRAHPMLSLRASAGQATKLRMGKFFVSVQVACAFCLVLVGAAFLFSLVHLLRVNPGFDARHTAVLKIGTEASHKPEPAQRALMLQLQTRVASQADVQGAALAMWPIFEGGGWSTQVIVPGKGPSEQEEIFYRVSAGYFLTLRTPLLAGRDFQPADSEPRDPSPVIVNEAFARKYFGRPDVLGQEFSYPYGKARIREVIVGVASDAHYYDLRTPAYPIAYLPIQGDSDFTIYVRSPMKLGTLARIVEREARALGSGTHIGELTSLEALVGNTLLREKLLADIGGAFAFFGLLLASIGLFGLLSYSVGRRTREIGIRTTLGAQRMEIVSLVLRDIATLLGGGLITGLIAALAMLTLFRSLLFGIQKVDSTVIAAAIALFLTTAFVAAFLPARRAAAIDPMSALRQE